MLLQLLQRRLHRSRIDDRLLTLRRPSPTVQILLQRLAFAHTVHAGYGAELRAVDGDPLAPDQAAASRQPHQLRSRWRSPPRGASAGTRRLTCGPDTAAPAATSTPRCGGTRLPTAATSGSGADIHTDKASTDRADHSPDAPSRLLPHARSPTLPSPARPRTHRSPGTHDRPQPDRPAPPETAFPDSAPLPGYSP